VIVASSDSRWDLDRAGVYRFAADLESENEQAAGRPLSLGR
jgi:hypothetical protein